MVVNCRYCMEDLGCEPWLMAWGEPAHKRCYDKAVENVRPQDTHLGKRQAVSAVNQSRPVRVRSMRRSA